MARARISLLHSKGFLRARLRLDEVIETFTGVLVELGHLRLLLLLHEVLAVEDFMILSVHFSLRVRFH